MKRLLTFVFLAALLLGACSFEISPAESDLPQATETRFVTATLPASRTPRATSTNTPLAPTNTVEPVTGTTTTKINVRAEPNTSSETLGVLAEFVSVDITGKDPSESWYRIAYPESPDGDGWVTALYIQVTGKADIPVIGGGEGGDSSLTGLLTEMVNVRSGPGTGYNALGTLNANDVVTLSGKNGDDTWLQIEYPTGPEEKGWVAAAFVSAKNIEDLPIVTDEGAVVGTGTPTIIPATPTATVVPAPEDGDAKNAPLAKIVLSPSGNQSFQYSGDVSTPQGDLEDWIQLTVQASQSPVTTYASLTCSGNKTITVTLWQGNQKQVTTLECDDSNIPISVTSDTPYLFQLSTEESDILTYSAYTLKVALKP